MTPYTEELEAQMKRWHSRLARGLEEVVSADDVGIDVKARLLDRGADAGSRGQMDDGIDSRRPRNDAVHGGGVADVGLVDADPVLRRHGDWPA